MVKSAVCGVSALTLNLCIGAQDVPILPHGGRQTNRGDGSVRPMASVKRAVGDLIGGYKVVETLGRGGSGAVYKVEDAAGNEAALKLVDAKSDGIAARRLEREVEALQSLRHPAVPRVIDVEFEEDSTFVVFELVPGVSLFYYVQEHGPLEGEELASFAETIASALEAVHAAGVVHRDVTPSNIMMGTAGPVLIDFGLSHRPEDDRLTRDGLVSGTAGYVAPEVINGTEPGPTADCWAWAATVAFAMTGNAPFGSGTGAIGKTLEADPELPDVVGAHAVAAALGRDVEARPGMRDVVAALRGATEALSYVPEQAYADAMEPTLVGPGATAVMPAQDASGDSDVMYVGPDVDGSDADDAWVDGDEDLEYEDTEQDDGSQEGEDPHLWEDEGGAPWRPRRPLTIGAWLTALAASAALAPLVSIFAMIFLAILARTAYRRAAALDALHMKRGLRRSDSVVQTIGLPWHLLRATGEVLPAVIVAAAAASGITALLWWMVAEGHVVYGGPAGRIWEYATALALGAGSAAMILWWGPWMSGTRAGAHRIAGTLAPTKGVAGAWVVVAIAGIAVVALAVYVQLEPWWWPLAQAPAGVHGPLAGN